MAFLILSISLPENTSTSSLQERTSSVLIIDAMHTVNMVPKAVHFSNKFVDIVAGMGSANDELQVVFDWYILSFLKKTRHKRILQVTLT